MSEPLGPGIWDLPLRVYLDDPAPTPSLSAGIAHRLLSLSPAHAWHAYHNDRRTYRRDGAIGTAFHTLFLGKGGEIEVIDADSFLTKAARQARDDALEAGKTPIKIADYELALAMVDAADRQLAAHEIGDFRERPGKAEQTLIWQEGETYCRACVDWLPDDPDWIVNLKTTGCAEPDWWQRNALRCGYDLSEAHYVRGIRQLLGIEVRELFVVIETKPPYALSVNMLPNGALAMAEKKRGYAVTRWAECLRRNSWPAYPSHICSIEETPGYHESEFIRRELSGQYDPEMLDRLIDASAP